MATVLDLNLIPTYNVASLGLADISSYGVSPTNVSMEITAPGFNKVNVTFTPNAVNIYNASHFDVDCDALSPLPDGIYYVKYSVHPNLTTYVEKSFMRLEQLLCKYYNTRLSLDANCHCKDKSIQECQLQQVAILMEGSIASANQCDPDSAFEKYEKAEKLLRNMAPCDC